MKNENKRKIQERKETPVSDGDTRPDLQPHEKWPVSNEAKGHVTEERGADTNSLEDYKDSLGTKSRKNTGEDSRKTSGVPKHDEENE